MAQRKDRIIKNDGTYIFSDFSKGLYLLDTPRTIGEQLGSLALIDGRNCFCEKGALVPQYGYVSKASLPTNEKVIGFTEGSIKADTFMIVTYSGLVFLYSASQGLKRYKTTLPESLTSLVMARNGKNLIMYLKDRGMAYQFGAFYENSNLVNIADNIPAQRFTTYYIFQVPLEYSEYFWNGKEICLNGEHRFLISSCNVNRGDNFMTVRAYSEVTGSMPNLGDTVSIGEKALQEISFTYVPDKEGKTPVPQDEPIVPTFMAVSQNRLFIVHTNGTIYHSAIGLMTNFNELDGAGKFGGFYNDTSNILSIEEFVDGTLICKETGLFYLTINIDNSIEVKKISQIGQQYASDHVVVGDKVYAYDVNSGSIVNAVGVNVFGALVSGKPLVSSEYINTTNFNIDVSKRALTYNAEAECFILYYGPELNKGIVLTSVGTLFPRELNLEMVGYIGFNQGVVGISEQGEIIQDFKKGTVIPNLSTIATFEAIGLRDNRLNISTVLEVTELTGSDFNVTTENETTSYQSIIPSHNIQEDNTNLPALLYSTYDDPEDSFELSSRWAEYSSNITRIAAPMSGRNGVSITLEFPANKAFCLSALRLPDFCQGA